MQSLIQFHKRTAEYKLIKGHKPQDLFRAGRWASIPSPVLLCELKLCAAGGKPSTMLPPAELVEQLGCTLRHLQQPQEQTLIFKKHDILAPEILEPPGVLSASSL